jgi:hypothetical protein
LIDLVKFYRPMGFFAEFEGRTDEDVADRLTERDPEWMKTWVPGDPYGDIRFIGNERFWMKDIEYGMKFRDQGIYVEALKEWAAISRGSFQPERITETWAGDEGPIAVEFVLNGQRRTLRPEYLEDYLDCLILGPINQMIEDTGFQFYDWDTGDQRAMIVVLADGECRRIREVRGLRFYKSPLLERDLEEEER